MEKKYIIIGVVIIVIIIIACFVIMNNTQHEKGNIIKISSNDNSVNGKLHITEFKNIKANSNGTYNISQFGTGYGVSKGIENDILIENGQAEYKLDNETTFFIVDSYITSISPQNNTNITITVEYVCDGKVLMTSSDRVGGDMADVTFGGANNWYNVNGSKLGENDWVIDVPQLQQYLEKSGYTA